MSEAGTPRLAAAMPDAILETVVAFGETTFIVPRERLRAVLAFLRDDPASRFSYLSDLTAVDLLNLDASWGTTSPSPRDEEEGSRGTPPNPQPAARGGEVGPRPGGARFMVVYHLYSPTSREWVRVKVPVGEDDPIVPSIVELWPGANWFEREVWDMFGISFDGHPSLERILMPDDWIGHPLRKDQPVIKEEIEFSHNVERLQRGLRENV